jgi:hypothetical protein
MDLVDLKEIQEIRLEMDLIQMELALPKMA